MATKELALEGVRWVLISMTDADGTTGDVLPGFEATATFENGRVAGKSFCNQYGAGYRLDGYQISVNEQMMSTMMACPEPVMRQEQQFQANLRAAATYVMDGSTLTIVNAAGKTMLTMKADVPTPLTGTNWIARNYNNGRQAVVSLLSGTTITLLFSEDGRLSGSSGCNNYMAGYTVSGSRMTIEAPAGTRKMCGRPEGIMEQEARYLQALVSVATYRIEGKLLELRTDQGSLVASYQPTDASG